MIDFQLSPDLSKRKYIYKDITLSNNNNNNQNQMNWVCEIIQPIFSSFHL